MCLYLLPPNPASGAHLLGVVEPGTVLIRCADLIRTELPSCANEKEESNAASPTMVDWLPILYLGKVFFLPLAWTPLLHMYHERSKRMWSALEKLYSASAPERVRLPHATAPVDDLLRHRSSQATSVHYFMCALQVEDAVKQAAECAIDLDAWVRFACRRGLMYVCYSAVFQAALLTFAYFVVSFLLLSIDVFLGSPTGRAPHNN